jgi:hypothetical protein
MLRHGALTARSSALDRAAKAVEKWFTLPPSARRKVWLITGPKARAPYTL